MKEEIRKYVNNLFKNAPNTKKVNDLKDEIISNTTDKYNDLTKNGETEKDAYEKAIKDIGSVDELVDELIKENPINKEQNEEDRKKTALVVSVSVGFYILSVIALIVLAELKLPDFIAVSAFLVLAGIPTCVITYYFMSKPKYTKYESTMVEEFKEWKGQKDNDKEIKQAISSILWTLTVIIYLAISFIFGIWYISWIIFIIAALVENIINLILKLRKGVK